MCANFAQTDKDVAVLYQIVYADPPWHYKVWSKKGASRTASIHYNVMGKSDIQAIPVGKLCDKNCALFMWATYPNLEEAIELVNAWGFEYKTVAFTWVKQNKKTPSLFWGMGHWTRSNAEVCILATKGKPHRINKGVHSVVMSAVQEHSRKPDEVRNRIVKLMGDLPRIELFARRNAEGWDAWGNEVENSVQLKEFSNDC